jgi:NAD(P) transhydrogenase subunit beta
VTIAQLTELIYLISAGAFILSLKWMSDPKTARRGVFAGVGAMVLAVAGTLLHPELLAYHWIAVAVVLGFIVGVPLSWVPLTAVPQRTALSHAFGGLAAGLVGTAKYYTWLPEGELTTFRMAAIGAEVLLGFLACTGSLMAAGKLQEIIPTRPLTYRNQNLVNLSLIGLAVVIAIGLVFRPETSWLFPDNTLMLFGDAKVVVGDVVKELAGKPGGH